jgi:hypothetical protein
LRTQSQEQLRYVTMQWHPAHGSKTETKLWWSFNCTPDTSCPFPTVTSKPRWIRPWWGALFWDRRDCANALAGVRDLRRSVRHLLTTAQDGAQQF